MAGVAFGIISVYDTRSLLVAGCIAVAAQSWSAPLPPAPDVAQPAGHTVGGAQQEVTLFLELAINGVRTSKVVPVLQIDSDLQVRNSDLLDAGIRYEALRDGAAPRWIALASYPEIRQLYDRNALLLELWVPPSWLAQQHLGGRPGHDAAPATSGQGVLLNYDAYVSKGNDRRTLSALWSQVRAFTGQGVLSTTGSWRQISGEGAARTGTHGQQGYVRYDTQWTGSDESRLLSWTVGDLITATQAWSSPVRLGGVKLSSDFRLRPGLITYPLPEFSGQAAIPSTIDLFVNGYRTRTERVLPGPFTLTDIPFINGAGEATIVSTDALGRQVATTLPFYVSSELLQQGLADYSVSLGALRRDYGFDNFAYDQAAAVGNLRYGVHENFTIESQLAISTTAAAGAFSLAGAGGVLKAGMAGVMNASASHSEYRGIQGWQYSAGYHYAFRGFNSGYQAVRSTAGFRPLGSDAPAGALLPTRRSDVITANVSMGAAGTAGVGYFDMRAADGARLRLLNLSYTRQVRAGVSCYLSLSRDLERRENTFMAQMLVSLGRSGHFTVGSQQDSSSSEYLNYTRSVPTEGGIGGNLGYSRTGADTARKDATLAWSNEYSRAEAGFYGTADERTTWGNLRGSLILMSGEVFVARQISDAFVVISTDGIADIPVRYENQLVGRTGSSGHLLVPWVTSYYPAKYEIDPLDLPPDLRIPEVEQRLTVRRGSGAALRFVVQPIAAAVITAVDATGAHLPVGSVATDLVTGQQAAIGFDGLLYFEELTADSEVAVTLPDGGACRMRFHLEGRQLAIIGPLTCE